jgi:hypothetical protein
MGGVVGGGVVESWCVVHHTLDIRCMYTIHHWWHVHHTPQTTHHTYKIHHTPFTIHHSPYAIYHIPNTHNTRNINALLPLFRALALTPASAVAKGLTVATATLLKPQEKFGLELVQWR